MPVVMLVISKEEARELKSTLESQAKLMTDAREEEKKQRHQKWIIQLESQIGIT